MGRRVGKQRTEGDDDFVLEDGIAAIVHVYEDDLVEKGRKRGIVTAVGGASDSEEEDEDRPLEPGLVRIDWVKAATTVEPAGSVTVLDRSFLIGDIVYRIADPQGQKGTVIDVSILCDIKFQNGFVLKNVGSKSIQSIHPFQGGAYIVKDGMFGVLDQCHCTLEVVFKDGSVCEIEKADPYTLVPVELSKLVEQYELDEGTYYPGQLVQAQLDLWRGAVWKIGNFSNAKRCRGVGKVKSIRPRQLSVDWVSSFSLAPLEPTSHVDPADVVVMDHFDWTTWQTGDHCSISAEKRAELTKLQVQDEEKTEGGSQKQKPTKSKKRKKVFVRRKVKTIKSGKKANVASGSVAGEEESGSMHGEVATEAGSEEQKHVEESKDSQVAGGAEDGGEARGTEDGGESGEAENGEEDGGKPTSPKKSKVTRRRRGRRKPTALQANAAFRNSQLEEGINIGDILATRTTATVQWQDGSISRDLDTMTLAPYLLMLDQHFFPKEFITSTQDEEKIGVVISSNEEERTVLVRWVEGQEGLDMVQGRNFLARQQQVINQQREGMMAASAAGDPQQMQLALAIPAPPSPTASSSSGGVGGSGVDVGEELREVEVSAYTVQKSEEFAFAINSIVIRLPDGDMTPTPAARNWIGMVLHCNSNARVTVRWSDGSEEDMKPQFLLLVDIDPGIMAEMEDYEDEGDEFQRLSDFEAAEEGQGFRDRADEASRNGGDWTYAWVGEDGVARRQGAADAEDESQAEVVDDDDESSLSDSSDAGVGGGGDKPGNDTDKAGNTADHPDGVPRALLQANDERMALNTPVPLPPSDVADQNQDQDQEAVNGLEEEDGKGEGGAGQGGGGVEETSVEAAGSEQLLLQRLHAAFPSFDVCLTVPPTHYFCGEPASSGPAIAKRVRKEWKALRKDMPRGIFVRVFEARQDLLQFCFVGSQGTPFFLCFFLFDLLLGSTYPSAPPRVFYHSQGLRLHPNLYAEGKVCLSLLDTWNGKGSQMWDPSNSNLLQVAVSLQGLVLGQAKPYFMEAGYEKLVGSAEGEHASRVYNETALIKKIQFMTMACALPDEGLATMIKAHYAMARALLRDLEVACATLHAMGAGVLGEERSKPLSKLNEKIFKQTQSDQQPESSFTPFKFESLEASLLALTGSYDNSCPPPSQGQSKSSGSCSSSSLSKPS